MSAPRIIAVTIAVVVLIGGVAALGAAAPADAANETAANATANGAADLDDRTHPAANASEPGANTSETVGPSAAVPEQAPDHVGEIHERIDGFLQGTVDDLGEVLAALLTTADERSGS